MAYKNLLLLSPVVLLLLVGTGCGSPYATKINTGSSSITVTDAAGASTSASSTGTTGTQAPYRVAIQGSGYDSHSVVVSTGSTLKVAFIAGKQNAEASGVFYPYSVLAVYMGVGTNLQPTQLIENGYGGGTPQESTVIDLSSSFTSTCSSSDPTCRQKVTVIVTQPNNDDACINSSYANCPYSHVPSGHPWNGTLLIQTDDTTAI
jgi:hypothetical protein